jgi:hypothetical protein
MLWVQLYDTQGRHRHEGVRRGNNREMEVKIRELLAVSHPEVAKIELDPPENPLRWAKRRDRGSSELQ